MIIQKIEAIRIPKKVSKYKDDFFMLLFQSSIRKHALPNGRMQDMFTWTVPLGMLSNFLSPKDAILFHINNYIDEIRTYKDGDGKLYDIYRFKKEVKKALQDALTIEENHHNFYIGTKTYYTSKDLWNALDDIKYHMDVFIDRGYYNLNETMCNEAVKDSFIVKSGEYYVNEENGKPALSVEPGSAREFSEEDEALDFALLYSELLSENGYEIIKYEGMPHNYALKYLREFRTPKAQTFQII